MTETFTYQISDLDRTVTDSGLAQCERGDVLELAEELEDMLLTEEPAITNRGLVLVICDASGSPVHFRPLGTIH